MSKKGYVGKVEEVEIPEHPFPFPELRPYQKAVFNEIQKKGYPLPSMRFGRHPYSVGIDLSEPGGDKSVIAYAQHGKNGIVKIWFDEYADFPNYKWYRNPIKWWKFRRLWKKIMDIPQHDTYRLQQLTNKKGKNNVKTN